jgi:hypothetical protein
MEPTRRTMMATGGAALAVAATPHAFGRYPDPAVEVLDPSFAKYRLFNAAVERLATGMRWSEGPVWFGDGRYLLWSDIPNNRILRWDEETGRTSEFRRPSNYANVESVCFIERLPPARREADQPVAIVGDKLVRHRVFPHADARAAAPRLAHLLAPARALADPGEELAHDQADRLGHGALVGRSPYCAASPQTAHIITSRTACRWR